MAVIIPDRYKPRFIDAEKAVVEMLQVPASECSPPGKVVTALPPGTNSIDGDEWYLIVTRTGGGVDAGDRVLDKPVVAVSALSALRSDSWELAGMARAIIEDYAAGGRTESYKVMSTAEHVGPVQNPFASPDRRIVTLNFSLTTRKLPAR